MQALFKRQIMWRSGRRIWTTLGDVWTSAKVGGAGLEECVLRFSCGYIRVLTPLCICFTESSKELEELRGAFSRSLDYMKQDVEERM